MNYVIGALIWAGIAWVVFTDSGKQFFGNLIRPAVAACTVENLGFEAHTSLTATGELDFGVMTRVTVLKTNRDGDVTISVDLSSTEGNLSRERTVAMSEGERSVVGILFSEPTINAQDIRGSASCSTI